ncbi:MAG: UTP--glucose-1-phosphate uridylyltransferase [Phycisphaerae bacterium]
MPDTTIAELQSRGHHVVAEHYQRASAETKALLKEQLSNIDWQLLDDLVEQLVMNRQDDRTFGDLKPATVYDESTCNEHHPDAIELGHHHLREGKVAAFTVAGGQGSRLGFSGPKGAMPFVPVTKRTLFEIFAMTIKRAGTIYETTIPWFIMTSQENDRATRAFFNKHAHFGLAAGQIHFVQQRMLPVVDFDGKLLMSDKGELALAPNGHGGSLDAMAHHHALQTMRDHGIETISYFQVDNPLVQPFDPSFIGMHIKTGSDMSTKVTPKAHDHEPVGNVCLADDKLTVIEYSEFPKALCEERNEQGARQFDTGNLAIHLLDLSFVEKLTKDGLQLPYRRAEKKVSHQNAAGEIQQPDSPNAVKFETFIFDALPLANNPLVYRVNRATEFAPVKNATGSDSLTTSRDALAARSRQWLSVISASWAEALTTVETPIYLLPSRALNATDVMKSLGDKDPSDLLKNAQRPSSTTAERDADGEDDIPIIEIS